MPSAPEPEMQPEGIIERDILEARKYAEYLLNALYTRTTKDVAKSDEFQVVLKQTKALMGEIQRLQEQIEALLDIVRRHEG